MKARVKSGKKSLQEKRIPKSSKEYTIEELIELGKERNILELAHPLYNDDKQDSKE